MPFLLWPGNEANWFLEYTTAVVCGMLCLMLACGKCSGFVEVGNVQVLPELGWKLWDVACSMEQHCTIII